MSTITILLLTLATAQSTPSDVGFTASTESRSSRLLSPLEVSEGQEGASLMQLEQRKQELSLDLASLTRSRRNKLTAGAIFMGSGVALIGVPIVLSTLNAFMDSGLTAAFGGRFSFWDSFTAVLGHPFSLVSMGVGAISLVVGIVFAVQGLELTSPIGSLRTQRKDIENVMGQRRSVLPSAPQAVPMDAPLSYRGSF
jgi:hypothetical protein